MKKLLAGATMCMTMLVSVLIGSAKTQFTPHPLEPVEGSWCYSFGDDETPAQAKRKSIMLAQEQAVRGYRVFVKSQSRVTNFQLEEDLIEIASAAILQNISIKTQDMKDREVCTTIQAVISPVSLEELIEQQVNAKDISNRVQLSVKKDRASAGLSIRLNKPDGHYFEGDQLIIYVKSEEDTYIKIDYYQADGKVVHLVPNRYRLNSFIKGTKNGGQEMVFGDSTGEDSFIIQEPFGAESIKVSVSPRPFPIPREIIDDSRKNLQRERSGVRGVRIRASTSVQLQTTSLAVEKYRKEKTKKN